MQISKKSWHYRYLTESNIKFSDVPENLCPYVRHMLLQFVAQWLVLFLILGTVAGPIWLYLFGFDTDIPFIFMFFIVVFFILLFVASIFGTLFGLHHLLQKYLRPRQLVRRLAREEIGEITFWQRLKIWGEAVHGRLCPIVDWTE